MEFKRLPSQLLDNIHFEKSYGYLLSNLLADCWCACACVFCLFHCLFVVHFNWPPQNCYTRPMFACLLCKTVYCFSWLTKIHCAYTNTFSIRNVHVSWSCCWCFFFSFVLCRSARKMRLLFPDYSHGGCVHVCVRVSAIRSTSKLAQHTKKANTRRIRSVTT